MEHIEMEEQNPTVMEKDKRDLPRRDYHQEGEVEKPPFIFS